MRKLHPGAERNLPEVRYVRGDDGVFVSRHRDADLGALGEDVVRGWCGPVGLTPTRPERDLYGWDLLIEFGPEYDDSRSYDSQSDLKKVLVQVKSTDSPGGSCRAKLSSLKHLVDADLPALVVFLNFSGQNTPTRCRLLHIGEAQIATVLSEVRKCESQGHQLNRRIIQLSMKQAAPIATDGRDFRSTILSLVHDTADDYATRKRQIRNTCGLGKDAYRINVIFPTGLKIEKLVNLMLGLERDIPVEEFISRKLRFGIELEKETHRSTSATISVDPRPFRTARLTSKSSTGISASLTADVFGPDIPGLPRENLAFLFRTPILDLHIRPYLERAKLTFRHNADQEFEIEHLARFLRFEYAAAQADARLNVEVEKLSSFEFDLGGLYKCQVHKLPYRVAELIAHIRQTHRPDLDLRLSRSHLLEIIRGNSSMCSASLQSGLYLNFSTDKFPDNLVVRRAILFQPSCIYMGNLFFYVIAKIEGANLNIRADGFDFRGDEPQIIESGVWENSGMEVETLNDRAIALSRTTKREQTLIIAGRVSDVRSGKN